MDGTQSTEWVQAPEEIPSQSKQGRRPLRLQNRLRMVMAHTVWYAFEPQARLARSIGVSRSTISRIVAGKVNPSFDLVRRITEAMEKELDRPLDPRDLFSPDGTYPTRSACELCGCDGCFPEEAYDCKGNLRPGYETMRPGDWTLAPEAVTESGGKPA